MASLQDIRRRIRSVKNTQQVTKAMKMISAVKLRKAQERLLSTRPFVTALHESVGQVTSRLGSDTKIIDDPLAQAFFSPREEKKIHLVAIAGDKGLCGGFNTNLLKAAELFLKEHPGKTVKLDAIGKRAAEWAKKSGIRTSFEATSLTPDVFSKTARDIAERAIQGYAKGEIDALYLIYNHFNSAVSQSPKSVRVFPPDEKPEATGVEHLLEPDPETVLRALLPYYVETEIYRAMLESSTSEHAARMAAMDKATSNANEMIEKLTLHMNKVRQAAITNQIIEVVSGAAVS
ncbi:MAG: ATP synthase F1 subunit gamma [Holophagales bacterium]|jgi:F-type H+-transporting ATPase subunit gamma|nr:ATP synthase F1 subunit gamma [Holophagales bacterium]